MSVKKQSFSLSPETVVRLDRVSAYLSISKSALVDQLLGAATDDMCQVLDIMPKDPKNLSEGDLLRFRGGSVAVVQSRVDDLRAQVNEL